MDEQLKQELQNIKDNVPKVYAAGRAAGGQHVDFFTEEGTVVSQNADFAEVAEWADGNPDNEDRTGYFVCANVPLDGIVMKKAKSTDDVKGVTILAPAFAGNYSKDKLDPNGKLLPKYSYVAIIGFVPVRDKGRCTVGGRCMPDDDGCAVPSSNSMGYQVVRRIDDDRVLIIIEPNGDMVQRIKTQVNQIQKDIDNIPFTSGYTRWKENKEYHIGDLCYTTIPEAGFATTILMKCKQVHISSGSVQPDDLDLNWEYFYIHARGSIMDICGNPIHTHYATKEELAEAIGQALEGDY